MTPRPRPILPRPIRRILKGLAIALFCVTLWSGSLTLDSAAAAQSIDTLRQRQQQIHQQRQNLDNQRDRLQQQENSVRNQLDNIQDSIDTAVEEIDQNATLLEQANKRLSDLRKNLARSEQTYDQNRSATVARLQFLQRQQQGKGWALLLQSRSLNEFLDRRYQLRRVYAADRQVLAQLRQQADDLKRRRRQVERQKTAIALLMEQIQNQKSVFEAQAQAQKTTIQRLRRDRQAVEAAQARLERDSDSIAALIQQRLVVATTSTFRGTGIFTFPTDGPLTSSFGYRVHPILGYRRFHAGIDFGAPTGTPIRAADSGTIIYAGWYGGYGNTVIVDHGGGISTLYAHASALYVSEGQSVQRGQVIAAVGSTGFSTGPHLHFEVRRSGEPVDPLAFL